MKKQDLLKRIEPLFFDKTYKEVSLQNIADIFQIKKSSLYYYFESKDDLYIQLLNYSFENYKLFLNSIFDMEMKIFIKEFLYFPQKSKNFFSIINQNGYCNNPTLKKEIMEKQYEMLDFINIKLSEKYWFSKAKSFVFISLLEDIWRKKCLFWECPLDIDNVILEINTLFKK